MPKKLVEKPKKVAKLVKVSKADMVVKAAKKTSSESNDSKSIAKKMSASVVKSIKALKNKKTTKNNKLVKKEVKVMKGEKKTEKKTPTKPKTQSKVSKVSTSKKAKVVKSIRDDKNTVGKKITKSAKDKNKKVVVSSSKSLKTPMKSKPMEKKKSGDKAGKGSAKSNKSVKSTKGATATTLSAGKGKRSQKKPPVNRKWTEEQKRAAALKRQSAKEGAKDRIYRSVDDWEGNSDTDGSVDSGAMEENICFECGKLTINDVAESIVVCDVCASEIHLECLGLTIVPRKGYVCPRCKEDEYNFGELKYDVYKPDVYKLGKANWSRESNFPIPKLTKNAPKIEYVYSPSRPIEEAWPECVEKGFMSVSRVFDASTMIKLTHGILTKTTGSGRSAEKWSGALQEIENKIGGNVVTNLIDRNGRYDMRLPDFVIEQLGINEKLKPILDRLATIMGTPKPVIRTQNVVFVPVGSQAQEWHIDDTPAKTHRYFTILIHLNPVDENCGGTELYSKQLKKGDMVRNRPGDAFVFNGTLLHRGQANNGRTHRLFYYASFACRADANIAV
jgi:hypothetical protein